MFSKIEELSKEQLLELVQMYAKNWLVMDGVWFQSVEQKFGMDEAMEHDANAWRRFTEVEAKRIKEFLKLPDNSGIEGLKQALAYRFYSALNNDEILVNGNTLIYRTCLCRVQMPVKGKGWSFTPANR